MTVHRLACGFVGALTLCGVSSMRAELLAHYTLDEESGSVAADSVPVATDSLGSRAT